MPKTREELDRAYIRYIYKIADYLNGQGKFQDEVQRTAIVIGIESWLRLSPDGLEDDALMARLLEKADLWANDAPPVTTPPPPPKKKTGKILLPVRWNPQTDNAWRSDRLRPDNTCSCSSTDAFLNYYMPGTTANDNEYVKKFDEGNYGDTTDHDAHVRCCEQEFGLLTEFRQDFTFDLLDAELEADRVVIIAILHRGPRSAPTGGHVTVCRGRNEKGDGYYFMDPYGSMNDGYQGQVENGKCAEYSKAELQTRWYAPPGYPAGGYARIYKGVAKKQ